MMASRKGAQAVIKKAQYYVWYLGWKECRGIGGREFTEPIVKELVHRRKEDRLPKLTVEVSRKELKVVQLAENKKGKIDKVKYPPVLAKDVTYAIQGLSPDEDVVACIYLGYNPHTKCAVHVHVYRCDSVETAHMMVNHINQVIHIPEHLERAARIEQELAEKGQVVPRPSAHPIPDDLEEPPPYGAFPGNARSPRMPRSPRDFQDVPSPGVSSLNDSNGSNGLFHAHNAREHQLNAMYGSAGVYRQNSGGSHGQKYSSSSDQGLEDDGHMFETLADELKAKLGKTPLLLPAKDYDTVNRMRGNLFDADNRACRNTKIVGATNLEQRWAIDSAKGDSDTGSQRNSQEDEAEHPNQPSPRSNGQFSGPSSPAFGRPERPFSPGPMTKDLGKSYFPGDKALPGYLPNERLRRSRESSGNESPRSGGANSRHAAPGPQTRHSSYHPRAQDEGYTSLERKDYPRGFFDDDRYQRDSPRGPESGPYAALPHSNRKLRRHVEEPPIDYTIAVRQHDREHPHPGAVFQ